MAPEATRDGNKFRNLQEGPAVFVLILGIVCRNFKDHNYVLGEIVELF